MDPTPDPTVLRVKRYANRKLYVPETKRYTNFQGLFDALMSGRTVRVTCVATGRDVSPFVLGMVYQVMCVERGAVGAAAIIDRIRKDGAARPVQL